MGDEEKPKISNPVPEQYLSKNPSGIAASTPKSQPRLPSGDLASSSIFERHREVQPDQEQTVDDKISRTDRNPVSMAARIDPEPSQRRRWERKMVIRAIQRRGRLSRSQLLKQTERESLQKSHWLKTSVKKLGPLARQIAGKTVEDAMLQMRFSKKKAAVEVYKFLEQARDEAIVQRGMGVGTAIATGQDAKLQNAKLEESHNQPRPIAIRLKDGKNHTVVDKSKIYVDQAWVGRGKYGKDLDYRARGRVFLLRPPHTSISVLLKEEATRVRQHQEREEKRANRKVWVQLPDRPLISRQQYYTW